ncbi:MAG: iron ABC transporter permease [Bacillota bacterium]|nr:iron ABC transporter permease [Bacillota bacterium]
MINIRQLKSNLNMWSFLSFIFVLLIILPTINIFISILGSPSEYWQHIKEYLLKDYIINTMKLVGFGGVFTMIIGTSLAWLVTAFRFPLRDFFKWALILPLAVPPYIAAFTYHGLLNYTGLIQTYLRNSLDITVNQKYFNIMSTQGAIFIFTMVLFPYVFAIVRAFLEKQSADLIENARVLGRSPWEIFITVVLPISRAAIIGGVSLVALEILNDYGLVQYFGITTFSVAIFRTWFGLGDLDSAVRLAAILMALVLGILLLEKIIRGRKRFSYTTTKVRPISPIQLKGIKSLLAFGYCFIIFSFGFLIPTSQLGYWAFLTYQKIFNSKFLGYMLNSVLVAAIAALFIITIALIIANYCRIKENLFTKAYGKITVLGYSIPGAVIAIAVIVSFIKIDNTFHGVYQTISPNSGKLILTTSIAMLIFAYVIRFLAIGYNSIESGFEKVGKSFFEASRMLGMNVTETFFKVDIQMIKPAIITGFILVFVDILKELPLTMILRPFNFHTLATMAYQYANNEMIHEAAIASLIIIFTSAVLVYFLNRVLVKEGN